MNFKPYLQNFWQRCRALVPAGRLPHYFSAQKIGAKTLHDERQLFLEGSSSRPSSLSSVPSAAARAFVLNEMNE